MRLRVKSSGNKEGFRAGKPLDVWSIRETVQVMLYDGEELECYDQEDDSVILEIKGGYETTRAKVLNAAEAVCSWGDMVFEEMGE